MEVNKAASEVSKVVSKQVTAQTDTIAKNKPIEDKKSVQTAVAVSNNKSLSSSATSVSSGSNGIGLVASKIA